MTDKKKGQDPMFPNTCEVATGDGYSRQLITDGISTRLYLAGVAMQGMLAHATRYKPLPDYPQNWHDAIAQEALELADSLIKAESEENQ